MPYNDWNPLLRRLILAWIVLTAMLLITASRAHGQSPFLEGHHKIVNARIPPPRLVKVGAETYLITVAPKFADPHLVGTTSNEKRLILILAGQKLEDEQNAVIHELFHAILKTEHSDDIQTTHEFIYAASGPEVKLLHDNPQLVRYLTQ